MQINGKDININDLLTEVDADIDKNIPKKRKNIERQYNKKMCRCT